MKTNKQELQGYFFIVGSILLFSFLPYYIQLLSPVDGNTLFAFRVLSQLGFGVLLLLLTRKIFILNLIFKSPKELVLLCLASPLIALQWWVFFWGPVNGETINIAMGYFLLPITMSLTGRFYYQEKLSSLLWLAIGSALFGVSIELYRTHAFSWVTLLICITYPPYFILRSKSKIPTTSNFVLENIFLTPIALLILLLTYQAQQPFLPSMDAGGLLLLGSGLLSTMAMIFFVSASRRLTFTVFGMLNYGEPILLMLVALFLLNEVISPEQLWSYSFFGVAVLLTISDRLLRIMTVKKTATTL